jgi:hypothetical protein
MRVIITEKGFEGYTGPLGMSNFTNGISDDHLSEHERLHLGAIMNVAEYDEKGDTDGAIINPGVNYAETYRVSAPIVEKAKTQAELNAEAALAAPAAGPAQESADQAQTTEATTQTELPALPKYTREELEVIADKDGIKGLRAISDKLNVKDSSIPGLMDKIIQAQSPNPEIPGVADAPGK